MSVYHPLYKITINNVSPKYASYWEKQGFIVTPSIKLAKSA